MLSEVIVARRLRVAAWSFLSMVGLFETIANRHAMQNDGVNYLDMGDAILRGDWKMALNGIWSPLYPFIQSLALRLFKPSAYWQFTVVHCINFLIFLFTLGCFEYFLQTTTDRDLPSYIKDGNHALPKWTVLAVSYAVFLWSSLGLITLRLVTPDMLMTGFLYLATGLVLRIWKQSESSWRFMALGAVLGLGYLTKAPVFLLAFDFFAIAWLLTGDWRRAAPRVLAGVLVFFAVSSPWFVALSRAKGKITFGESARFNYLIHVDGVTTDWLFQDLGSTRGQYIHPVRKIFEAPPIYEFATPVKATSATYDPSYWAEGLVPLVSIKREASIVHHWFRFYFDFACTSQAALFVGYIALCFMAEGYVVRETMARWPIWVLALIGLWMYALVHTELRYVAVFFTLFWVGLFSGLQIPRGVHSVRLASLVILAVVIATAGPTVALIGDHLLQRQTHVQWQVAQDLERLGVKAGDRVARLPAHFGLAWGRMLQVNEVAQIPSEAAIEFWCTPPDRQAQAIEILRHYGVAALVVEQPPPAKVCAAGPEWHQVGEFYAFCLKRDSP